MKDQKETLSVVKIGGGVIEDPQALKYSFGYCFLVTSTSVLQKSEEHYWLINLRHTHLVRNELF